MFDLFYSEEGKYHRLAETDILVLPMDMTDFRSHQDAVRKVIRHFGQVFFVHTVKKEIRIV